MANKRGLRRQLPFLSEKEIEQQNSWLKSNEAKEFFKSCEKAGKLFKGDKKMIDMTVYSQSCEDCSHNNICAYKEKRKEILNELSKKVSGYNDVLDDLFQVSFECKQYVKNTTVKASESWF